MKAAPTTDARPWRRSLCRRALLRRRRVRRHVAEDPLDRDARGRTPNRLERRAERRVVQDAAVDHPGVARERGDPGQGRIRRPAVSTVHPAERRLERPGKDAVHRAMRARRRGVSVSANADEGPRARDGSEDARCSRSWRCRRSRRVRDSPPSQVRPVTNSRPAAGRRPLARALKLVPRRGDVAAS